MHLPLPHFPFPTRNSAPTRAEDRIPTSAELSQLYRTAAEELQTLELLHAAEVAQFDRARAGLIARMGKLIAACEAYHGTDLRKVGG